MPSGVGGSGARTVSRPHSPRPGSTGAAVPRLCRSKNSGAWPTRSIARRRADRRRGRPLLGPRALFGSLEGRVIGYPPGMTDRVVPARIAAGAPGDPAIEPSVRILPLGGLGEIGLNMMLLESGEDLLAVDC